MLRCCLGVIGSTIKESLELLVDYIEPWMNMNKNEHRQKFFGILEGCAQGVSPGGHLNAK